MPLYLIQSMEGHLQLRIRTKNGKSEEEKKMKKDFKSWILGNLEKTMKCKAFKKKSNKICKVYNNQ